MTEPKKTKTRVELVSGSRLTFMLTDKEIYNLVQVSMNGGLFTIERKDGRAYIPGDKIVYIAHDPTDMRDGSVNA